METHLCRWPLRKAKQFFPGMLFSGAKPWQCAWMVTCMEVGGRPPWVSRSLCLYLAVSPCNLYSNPIGHTLPESLNLHICPEEGECGLTILRCESTKKHLWNAPKGLACFQGWWWSCIEWYICGNVFYTISNSSSLFRQRSILPETMKIKELWDGFVGLGLCVPWLMPLLEHLHSASS